MKLLAQQPSEGWASRQKICLCVCDLFFKKVSIKSTPVGFSSLTFQVFQRDHSSFSPATPAPPGGSVSQLPTQLRVGVDLVRPSCSSWQACRRPAFWFSFLFLCRLTRPRTFWYSTGHWATPCYEASVQISFVSVWLSFLWYALYMEQTNRRSVSSFSASSLCVGSGVALWPLW